jgi:hypothetical protein
VDHVELQQDVLFRPREAGEDTVKRGFTINEKVDRITRDQFEAG